MPLSSPAPDAYFYAPDLALANGASVSTWTDRIASKTVTQATGANQPSYSTSAINGQPGVVFNGTSDYLRLASGFGVLTGTNATVIVIAKMGSTAGRIVSMWAASDSSFTDLTGSSSFAMESNGASSGYLTFEGGNSGNTPYSASLGSIGPNSGTPPSGTPYILTGQRDSQSFTTINSGLYSGAAGGLTLSALSTGQLTFGADYQSTPAHFSDVTICEVLMWNRKLTMAEIFTVNQYAQQTYAIQITPDIWYPVGANLPGPTSGTALTSLSWGYSNLGDTVVVPIAVASSSLTVSSVSDARITTFTRAGSPMVDATSGITHEHWYGVITTDNNTTGPTTVAWSGSVAGLLTTIGIEELVYTAGAAVTYSSQSSQHNAASTTVSFPTLTSSQTNQLQFIAGLSSCSAANSGGSSWPPGNNLQSNTSDTGTSNAEQLLVLGLAPNATQPISYNTATSVPSTTSVSLFKVTAPALEITEAPPWSFESQFNDPGTNLQGNALGDLTIVTLAGNTNPILSGGGVTTWTQAYSYTDASLGATSVWYGLVTTLGGNQAFTGNGTNYINVTPFTSSTPGVWRVGSISQTSGTGTTRTFPSFTTSPLVAEEMYWGYCNDPNLPNNPASGIPGFIVFQPYNNASFILNRNLQKGTTYTPTFTGVPSASYQALGMVVQFLAGNTASVSASAAVTGTLSKAIPLTASISASSSMQTQGNDTIPQLGDASWFFGGQHLPDFFISRFFQDPPTIYASAAISASSAVTATNTETVALTAAISSSAAVAGTLPPPNTPITAAITATSAVAGTTKEAVALTGAVSASSAVAATNTETVALTAAISASSAVAATPTRATALALTSAISASSAVAGTSTEAVALTGSVTSTSAVAASNKQTAAISASISSSASTTATNTEAVALSSAVAATSSVTTANTEAVSLTAGVSASSALTATVGRTIAVASAINMTSAVVATAVESLALTASVSASSSLAGATSRGIAVSSAISASSSASATNSESVALSSTIVSSVTTTATASKNAALSAAISSSLTITSFETLQHLMTAALHMSSTLNGSVSYNTSWINFVLNGRNLKSALAVRDLEVDLDDRNLASRLGTRDLDADYNSRNLEVRL